MGSKRETASSGPGIAPDPHRRQLAAALRLSGRSAAAGWPCLGLLFRFADARRFAVADWLEALWPVAEAGLFA